MAIPAQNLGGTEVLRRGGINALTNQWVSLNFDGTVTPNNGALAGVVPANHIITILNFTACEQGNATRLFYAAVVTTGIAELYIINGVKLDPYRTYIHNDRITLVGGDKLKFATDASANVDVWVNYIDQSWE